MKKWLSKHIGDLHVCSNVVLYRLCTLLIVLVCGKETHLLTRRNNRDSALLRFCPSSRDAKNTKISVGEVYRSQAKGVVLVAT